MRVQRIRHTRAYVQIPNGIAQDSSMSLEALGLLTYLLSLPDANRATVERIASRVPNGRRVVSNAMNELITHGYVLRTRVQDPETGRWVTLTSVSDTPIGSSHPSDRIPTVGLPTGQVVGGYPKGKDAGSNDLPPVEASQQEPEGANEEREGEEESPQRKAITEAAAALTERAVKTLARLAIHDVRLLLSPRECQRLAPQVVPWLSEGFNETEVISALTRALPAEIGSAAALVTFRLRNFQPEHETPVKRSETPSGPVQRPVRNECPECRAPYRAGHPGGLCRDCREDG